MEVDFTVNLHTHIFCIELFDEDHIVCGQMNGWIDLVRIEDGAIIVSKELKHVTGNITILKKTNKEHELMIGA